MKLSTLNFLQLLPDFMRDDPAVQGLAEAVEDILASPAQEVPNAAVWNRIDQMDAAQLDELAWEMDIDWYDTNWTVEQKRETVKNSDKVYQKRGTKWAVEQVIKDVFGDGYVEEWTGYGGQPFHFRVTTSFAFPNDATIERFRHLIAQAKRASARLDSITFAHEGTAMAYTGATNVGISIIQSAVAVNL